MKFFKSFYIKSHFYLGISAIALLFILGYFLPFLFAIAKISLLIAISLFLLDIALLYSAGDNALKARRNMANRLSNGDENPIRLAVQNKFPLTINLEIIDEIPHQFQIRNFSIKEKLTKGQDKTFIYHLHPVKRGEYEFGRIIIYVESYIGLIRKRFNFKEECTIAVYPSYMQMRKYELLAISNRLTEAGIKKIRKISNSQEFEQIREYVKGDDFRTLNWKATARSNKLMVNQFQDEKSQQVFSVIDMGRTMKMPFAGMSLLDYAISSSLVISNIAILKQDKAGIVTFSKNVHTVLQAEKRGNTMSKIMECLYRQNTNYDESSLENLYINIKQNIKQRSLLLLYTNFEGFVSLERQLKYFKLLAQNHLLVVIFFENTEIKDITKINPESIEQIYTKVIAEKLMYDKKRIVKELNKHGIHAVYTEPQNLTVNTINKYLELKSRGLI